MSAWAVLSPDGELSWHSLRETAAVEALVSGDYAPGALDTATLVLGEPVRILASDIALAVPEHYAANHLAQGVITALSGGRITQPWRGHVALTEYERDDETGELLWPGEMSPQWARRITEAVLAEGGTEAGQ